MRYDLAPILHMFNAMQRVSDSLSYDILSPKFDVKEDKDTYILESPVPGINRQDIVVEFSDDHTLTIRGRTEHSREDAQRPHGAFEGGQSQRSTFEAKEVDRTAPEHAQWVSERSMREFGRGFTLPTRIDQARVVASLRNGVLSVVLPKLAQQNS